MSSCCGVEPIHKQPTDTENAESDWVEFAVFGMGCGSCANRVQNSLLRLEGVLEANVDHLSGLAQVVFDPSMTRLSDLFQAVVQAGGDGKHNYAARLLTQSVNH